jgi:hypothetical protein
MAPANTFVTPRQRGRFAGINHGSISAAGSSASAVVFTFTASAARNPTHTRWRAARAVSPAARNPK